MEVRQAAAVNFKNFIKPRWVRTCLRLDCLARMGFVKLTKSHVQAPQSDFDGVPLPDADKVCARMCGVHSSV